MFGAGSVGKSENRKNRVPILASTFKKQNNQTIGCGFV